MNENTIAAEIVRTKEIIAIEIRTHSNQFKEQALSYAIKIGRLLCEAKELVDHGEWGNWLEEQTEFKQSTANNLMRIYKEYSADQVGFFGDAKSQTLGNLSYSKALALLDVPAEEREAFAEDNNVDELSTRELEKLIKERDEALKGKTEAETQMKCAQEREKDIKIDYTSEKSKAAELDKKIKKLETELKDIKSKPIDIAVQEPDPEAVNEAVKAAEEKMEKELETMKTERDVALAKAAAAEKALAVADPSVTQFKVIFEEAQGMLNKLVGMLMKAEPDKRDGLRKALSTLLSTYGEKVKEGAA